MSQPVNLNKARKVRARAAAKAQADANAVAFARSGPKKRLDDATRARNMRALDGKKLQTGQHVAPDGDDTP